MAKLKIVDDQGKLLEQGYINVVEYLIWQPDPSTPQPHFQDFLDADPDERADILQTAADPQQSGAFVVEQEVNAGNLEPISSANCFVIAKKDRRRGGKRHSVVTVPVPDKPVNDFTYLRGYAQKIVDLYDPTDAQKLDRCMKFMFGVMMLTRCR